jgi:GT2 family glycosyltransferase
MKATIVIVVYNIHPEHSKTFSSFLNVLTDMKESNIAIIVYDNSPQRHDLNPNASLPIIYRHDGRNPGIAAAYNYALQEANKNGSEWLLLLDHDTQISSEYMNEIMELQNVDQKVAAVVPNINSENQMISPVFSDRIRPLTGDKPKPGIQVKPVMAINSGALVRVSFLNEIGGFNPKFPLDYLDHWLFHEVYSKGYQVLLLHSILEHELSVLDYSRVSLNRYKSILESEIYFYQRYKKELLPSYRTQLVKRFLKQVLTVKNKKIAMYTFKRLFSR